MDGSMLTRLISCQESVLRTISELFMNEMCFGIGEAATTVWHMVVISLTQFSNNDPVMIQNILGSLVGIVLGSLVGRETQQVWTRKTTLSV
mmetsp:Transcript_17754/g.27181  ORF Transcript_17754/g.27181 Transcript_17754/m.27181 type:complete len:91 (+) Transcript_17754:639-911(+)